MPEPLAQKSPDELAQHLLRTIHDANVTTHALTLMGVPVQLDLVERPAGHTEIHVRAGRWEWPPVESRGSELPGPPPGPGETPPA